MSELIILEPNTEYDFKIMPNYFNPNLPWFELEHNRQMVLYILPKDEMKISILMVPKRSKFKDYVNQYINNIIAEQPEKIVLPFDIFSDVFVKLKTYEDSDKIKSVKLYKDTPIYKDGDAQEPITNMYKGVTPLEDITEDMYNLLERDRKICKIVED
jgi:hypothetical protein